MVHYSSENSTLGYGKNSTRELYRPNYHFSPIANWMNDPNGLVYYKGKYHLFYQYHPDSTVWGPTHWGHAISCDLVNWQHLPIALSPDENGYIFSGSAVIDWQNTASFGKEAMVAVFTHDQGGVQSQSLAYSTDRGRTWTKYPGNPVLLPPNNLRDFRDPKVFWYGKPDAGHWVMALAADNKILFYTSPDLTHWTASGEFGPGYGSTSDVWETPDLFELSVDGAPETRWVLTVGVQGGGPARGSATQYFVGAFDGTTFTSENPKDTVLWADFGADYYAAQSWSNEPNKRCIMIAWQNNWQYANVIPAYNWRGTFSLPRELALTQTESGIYLVQQPISELQTLRGAHQHWQDETITPERNLLSKVKGETCEIMAEFQVNPAADRFGFRIRVGVQEATTIGYNVKQEKLFVDRTHSGQINFHPGFASSHLADLIPNNDILRLNIFVDCTSVEVFANDGLVVFSESIFPSEQSQGLELFTQGGAVTLKSLDIYQLNPARFLI
jgi:fructan beta-fructosidase